MLFERGRIENSFKKKKLSFHTATHEWYQEIFPHFSPSSVEPCKFDRCHKRKSAGTSRRAQLLWPLQHVSALLSLSQAEVLL